MKKVFRSPAFTGLLFLLALGLLLAGTIGGTRAALTIQSDIYTSQFELTDIGVALTEEGSVIAERDYISEGSWKGNPEGLLMYDISSKCMVERAGDTSLKIGKTYPLPVGVKNTGSIPEYLRVLCCATGSPRPLQVTGSTGRTAGLMGRARSAPTWIPA